MLKCLVYTEKLSCVWAYVRSLRSDPYVFRCWCTLSPQSIFTRRGTNLFIIFFLVMNSYVTESDWLLAIGIYSHIRWVHLWCDVSVQLSDLRFVFGPLLDLWYLPLNNLVSRKLPWRIKDSDSSCNLLGNYWRNFYGIPTYWNIWAICMIKFSIKIGKGMGMGSRRKSGKGIF